MGEYEQTTNTIARAQTRPKPPLTRP
jgi:hypothetical protein